VYILPRLSLGTHTITVRAFDRAGNYSEAIEDVIIEPIISPTIEEFPEHITSPGEVLIIKGTASSGAEVEIWMSRREEIEIVFTAKADQSGRWQAEYRELIPSGTYRVWAKQTLENGAESLPSQPVFIRVNSLLFQFWQWLKNIGGIIILLLLFLFLLILLIIYLWYRIQYLRYRMHREAKEAQKKAEEGIHKIGSELMSGVPPEKIAEDLEKVEEEIKKEIEDIDKLD